MSLDLYLQKLKTRSGLISADYAEALLKEAFKCAYNEGMQAVHQKAAPPPHVEHLEQELLSLRKARQDADLSFKISQCRLNDIQDRISAVEKRILSILQGQFEFELESPKDLRPQDLDLG